MKTHRALLQASSPLFLASLLLAGAGCDQVAKATSIEAEPTFTAIRATAGGKGSPEELDTIKNSIAWELNQAHVAIGAVQGDVKDEAVRTLLDQSMQELKAMEAPKNDDAKRFAADLSMRAGVGDCKVGPAEGASLAALQKEAMPRLPSGATEAQRTFFAAYEQRLQGLTDFAQVQCGKEKVRVGFARDPQTRKLLPLRVN